MDTAKRAVPNLTTSKKWSDQVTHLVVRQGAKSNSAGAHLPGSYPDCSHVTVTRSAKFVCAVLAGQWVVDRSWLTASAAAGYAVDEAAYASRSRLTD